MEGVGEEEEGCPTWGRALLRLLSTRMHVRPHWQPRREHCTTAQSRVLASGHQGQLLVE